MVVGALMDVPVGTVVAQAARVLVRVGTAVAEVAPVARPVAVRADSQEPRQEGQLAVLPRDVVEEAPEGAVVPVALVDEVVPVGGQRVHANHVVRSDANSTIWKLRPLAECGFPRGRVRQYDCLAGPR